MPTVTYDGRSFLIDDERVWLVSGSLHYFRVPAALWPDRLLKAKRAGLNCISTYVPWNFHEPEEGQWRFEGDYDVVEFVHQAEEMGLYVILRPGPYICAEWDFGGLPGWLTAKSGIAYRTANAAYTHYYDKYLANVLPQLAELQVARGGNIIAIQNENEYTVTTMPDRLHYLRFVSQLFQRAGFEVPILTCNLLSEPPVPGAIECVNGWDNVVADLQRLRGKQGDAPLLVTELHCGWFDHWGGAHQTKPARDVGRKALEILGCGAQFNYYMWHGGTNFAFWGSRLALHDSSYQTTSYDYDAPLAEGGGLTEKYYRTRLVNLLARHMGRYFASARPAAPAARLRGTTDVLNLSAPTGSWAVVTAGGREDLDRVELDLPTGRRLTVPLEPLGAVAVPVALEIDPEHVLDYANVMPLGLFGGAILVLHGPPGWDVELSVNSKELRRAIPDGDEPDVVEHEGVRVVLVSSDLAMRTWVLEDALVFGPAFVGADLDDVRPGRGCRQYAILDFGGKLRHRKVPATHKRGPTAPRLSQWKRVAVCTEPVADDLEWEKLDRPRHLDRIGVHAGYCWHRIEIEQDRARTRHLFLPDCEDRATLYLNGELLGVWGRGPDATRSPLSAAFRHGPNVLTCLLDNLGRFNFGPRLGEVKGLFGHIWDAKELKDLQPKLKQAEGFNRRIVPRGLTHLLPELERRPLWEATLEVSLRKVQPIHLSFTRMPAHVAVLCNERAAGFFAGGRNNFGDVTLGAELKDRKNRIRLLCWGDVSRNDLKHVHLHALNEPISGGAAWGTRCWQMPAEDGPVVGKDRPAWYRTRFKHNGDDRPLFLHLLGAHKGQIFLNGHNVGRFWNLGPQQHYYLPACWLQAENELLVFEEQGNLPRRSRLEFRPQGPYQP